MKIILSFILPICLTLSPLPLRSDLSTPPKPVEQQYFIAKPRLKNPGFELGTTSWTNVGATRTLVSNVNSANSGSKSITWDASSATDSLTSEALSVSSNNGLSNANVVGVCYFRVPSGTATHTLQLTDGSNVLVSKTITNLTKYTPTVINGTAPESGNLYLKLDATASDEPSIAVDDCNIFRADEYNLSQASQAELYGYLRYPATASCSWTTGNTSSAYTEFAADTDCGTAVVVGNASAPATKVPRIKFATLPPGNYQVIATGNHLPETTAVTAGLQYKLYDGTISRGYLDLQVNSTTSTAARQQNIIGLFTYATAQTNIEFRPIALSNSNSNDPLIDASLTGPADDYEFTVYRFPLASETAIKSENVDWQVIADITGANPSLGTSAVTSYTEIIDAGLTLTPVSGSAPAGIMCSTTNTATAPSAGATVCAAGSESIGVNFNIPKAGWYEACFQFSHYVQVDSAESIDTIFNIIQTPLSAQTITFEGGPRVESGLVGMTIAAGVDSVMYSPRNVCGQINFASAGNVGIRLMYEQVVSGTPDFSQIDADANTSAGQRAIRVTVRPMIVPGNAPQTINSVMNSSSGTTRIETAQLDCDSSSQNPPPYQLGSWISSVGNVSAGACAVTITSGLFSVAPVCTANAVGATSTGSIIHTTVTSTTAFSIDCESDASAECTDYDVYVTCVGAK